MDTELSGQMSLDVGWIGWGALHASLWRDTVSGGRIRISLGGCWRRLMARGGLYRLRKDERGNGKSNRNQLKLVQLSRLLTKTHKVWKFRQGRLECNSVSSMHT